MMLAVVIAPGFKVNESGRSKYKSDPKTIDYFWNVLVKGVTRKYYRQKQGVPYNPKYDGNRDVQTPPTESGVKPVKKKSALSSLNLSP